eukprot:3273656-Prymnesium_polylepis.1
MSTFLVTELRRDFRAPRECGRLGRKRVGQCTRARSAAAVAAAREGRPIERAPPVSRTYCLHQR